MADAENTQVQATQQVTAPEIDYGKIEAMINKGNQQKENAILKSYFEQQGMTEEEVKGAVAEYRANKQQAQEQKNAYADMQRE